MNIIEQRYDFLVDMKSLPNLEGAMFERLLMKSYRHKGWLYNYLYGNLDLSSFNPSQQSLLKEYAIKLYNRELS